MRARSFPGTAEAWLPAKGLALLTTLLCAGPMLGAQDKGSGGLQQMSLEEILNVKVTVASRTETTQADAPSVVSVITADDIKRMGARDLRDVLRSVPGFELGVRVFGYPEFGVRGVITDNTEKVRILLDGTPVNENLEGSGTIVFGDLALENVERIEIIRGPGSALYGTNAFVGVVSIITKGAPSSGWASTFVAKAGSFNTQEGSFRTGWAGPRWRVSAFLHYLHTDGFEGAIPQDGLTLVPDPPQHSGLNSGISLAGTPAGHTDNFRNKLSGQVKVEFADGYFNGMFVDARKGPYIGTLWAVNQHSEAHPFQIQGEFGWRFKPSETWLLEPKLYLLHYKADNLWNGAPEGYRAIIDNQGTTALYTQGRYDRQGGTQDTKGAELKATWSPKGEHQIVFGGSFEQQRLYRVVNDTNVPGYGPERMVHAGDIIKGDPDRSLASAYLQDQWKPRENLGITAGLRVDHYSDAGTATTPRMAIVWNPLATLTLKALYGEAFRAPTFVESYLFAYGGFAVGREGNKPEKIRTWEGEASLRFGDRALWRMVVFRNRITDLLQFVPTGGHLEYQNLPDATVVKGYETEVNLTFSDRLSAFANLSGQSGRNEGTGARLAGMANWRANAGVNLSAFDCLNVHASVLMVGKRERATGDPRPELSGYRVWDLALTYAFRPGLEFTFSAHNLGDADQRFLDLTGPLPNDFPWEGRDIQAGLHWRF